MSGWLVLGGFVMLQRCVNDPWHGAIEVVLMSQ